MVAEGKRGYRNRSHNVLAETPTIVTYYYALDRQESIRTAVHQVAPLLFGQFWSIENDLLCICHVVHAPTPLVDLMGNAETHAHLAVILQCTYVYILLRAIYTSFLIVYSNNSLYKIWLYILLHICTITICENYTAVEISDQKYSVYLSLHLVVIHRTIQWITSVVPISLAVWWVRFWEPSHLSL